MEKEKTVVPATSSPRSVRQRRLRQVTAILALLAAVTFASSQPVSQAFVWVTWLFGGIFLFAALGFAVASFRRKK